MAAAGLKTENPSISRSQKSSFFTDLSFQTFLLHNLCRDMSFCMHLDIYLICVYSQSYPNLMTGIRVMLQKPTRFSEKFCSPTAARWPTHRYYSSKQGCSTSHVNNWRASAHDFAQFYGHLLAGEGRSKANFSIFTFWIWWILHSIIDLWVNTNWKACEILILMNYWRQNRLKMNISRKSTEDLPCEQTFPPGLSAFRFYARASRFHEI